MRLSLNKHTYQKSIGLRIFSKSRAWIAKKSQVRFIAHIFEVNSLRARRERINELLPYQRKYHLASTSWVYIKNTEAEFFSPG